MTRGEQTWQILVSFWRDGYPEEPGSWRHSVNGVCLARGKTSDAAWDELRRYLDRWNEARLETLVLWQGQQMPVIALAFRRHRARLPFSLAAHKIFLLSRSEPLEIKPVDGPKPLGICVDTSWPV